VATKATKDSIRRAAAILRDGGLVAFPTETVYGLGADATNAHAVRRIFTVKGRPPHHPLIVHIGDVSMLEGWARQVPDAARRLAREFWPGPLTLILERAAHVDTEVTGGQDTIGLRVPAHPTALALLHAFGAGIAAPSANRFGHVSPTTAAHVDAELGDEVDLVLDGGACNVGIESTIVDLTSARARVLRPGSIGRAAVERVLGALATDTSDAPRVSGTLLSHYAPRTRLVVADAERFAATLARERHRRVGVIALRAATGALAVWRSLTPNPDDYGRALYAALREVDALGLDVIVVELPPDEPAWEAVRDRLARAASAA